MQNDIDKSESAALYEDYSKTPDNSFRNFGKTKPFWFDKYHEPVFVIGPNSKIYITI